MFIRVKDPSTGHEYDVPEDSFLLQRGLVKPVKAGRYPPSRYARRAKHSISHTTPQESPAVETPEEETA